MAATGAAATAVDPQRQLAAMKLKDAVEVFRVAKSTAVAIRVTSYDPVIAADVANAYADAYIQDILRRLPSHPPGRLEELLPEVWFAAHPSARRKTAA